MLRMGLRLRREQSEDNFVESIGSERGWYCCHDRHTFADDLLQGWNTIDEEIGIAAEFGFLFILWVTGH